MAADLTPGTTPESGGDASAPPVASTLEPGAYGPSLFGVGLPQGTGAPGSAGAAYPGSTDPTNQPGQLDEGISGEGPAQTADSGAPGTTGAQNDSGGPDRVTYTNPGSFLGGTYTSDTTSASVSGPNDWTQAIAGSYGGGPQLPGIEGGGMPLGTGAGDGSVLRGGRAVS